MGLKKGITQSQWPEIVKMHKDGQSKTAIGRVFGMSGPAIAYILRKAEDMGIGAGGTEQTSAGKDAPAVSETTAAASVSETAGERAGASVDAVSETTLDAEAKPAGEKTARKQASETVPSATKGEAGKKGPGRGRKAVSVSAEKAKTKSAGRSKAAEGLQGELLPPTPLEDAVAKSVASTTQASDASAPSVSEVDLAQAQTPKDRVEASVESRVQEPSAEPGIDTAKDSVETAAKNEMTPVQTRHAPVSPSHARPAAKADPAKIGRGTLSLAKKPTPAEVTPAPIPEGRDHSAGDVAVASRPVARETTQTRPVEAGDQLGMRKGRYLVEASLLLSQAFEAWDEEATPENYERLDNEINAWRRRLGELEVKMIFR